MIQNLILGINEMNIPHADYYFSITGKTNLNQKDAKIKTIPKPWKQLLQESECEKKIGY